MNIFVGNLSFEANEADVKKLFEGFGSVFSVAIVMEKQKKAPKSRGFGFVDMPDDEQALAAIAGLNAKEFMGRVLNVNPARSKEEAEEARKLKVSKQPKVKAQAQKYPKEETGPDKTWFSPVFRKPGTYKGGRRTNSYMKRKGLTGMPEETKSRKGFQDNPMRWRKKKDFSKPWQRGPAEHKPWQKAEGGAKTWRKPEVGVKPWKKPLTEAKPWKKSVRLAQKSKLKIKQKSRPIPA